MLDVSHPRAADVAATLDVLLLEMETKYDVDRGDEGPRAERDLGERNDGDADAHEDREAGREAVGPENVGCDGVADAVSKHENTNDGQTGIQNVLQGDVSD